MEYIDGLSLDAYVARHALSDADRLDLVIRLCDPIAYAYRIGVIHRDLKPANILVCADGQPKVVDFGVACTTPDVSASLAQQTGQMVGTLSYISPEQIDGSRPVDARTDVYALGIILYELLTGQLPIDVRGLGVMSALRRLSSETPTPLSQHRPDLPAFDDVIACATAADPLYRFADVRQLCEAVVTERRRLS